MYVLQKCTNVQKNCTTNINVKNSQKIINGDITHQDHHLNVSAVLCHVTCQWGCKTTTYMNPNILSIHYFYGATLTI